MLSFGVIICTYRRRLLLKKCLDSWSQSNRLPDQFIVVDATPGAHQYRQKIVGKFPQLFANADSQYLISPVPGLTLQRNLGLRALKTDIICFADDDAFVTPDYAEKILEVFQLDSQQMVGGVNGVEIGQFDSLRVKYLKLSKNLAKHHFGWIAQRIRIPRELTQLHRPIPNDLRALPLINIDRLWGANMNYRAELLEGLEFDENFKSYGLFEDVDFSIRVGKTHKLVCRLDAQLEHHEFFGQSTRPSDINYFLLSWLNSAYIIEKLLPYQESRTAHRRFFHLIELISRFTTEEFCAQRIKTFGTSEARGLAQQYITKLQNCRDLSSLEKQFIEIQKKIFALPKGDFEKPE